MSDGVRDDADRTVGVEMVLVPRKATEAMRKASNDAMRKRQSDMGESWFWVSNRSKAGIRWDAMIAAWEASNERAE